MRARSSALLPLVILTELGGGLLVLLGLFTRYAAIALAGFCVLAGYFFHFQPGDMGQMINFMKNITIAGGFLVLAGSGPGAFALDNLGRSSFG
jgi:putative oxidoreductase